MRPVAVAADSTTYLPRELARREGVHEVSLYVGWGDDPQRELDMEAVVARTREARQALRIWFCVDTLEYLRRGGRIGKAQAWLGGTLKIKPILSLEYEIVPVERVRTAGRAFERMVGYARELQASDSDGWVVQHIQAPEQAEHVTARCREVFDSEPVFTS